MKKLINLFLSVFICLFVGGVLGSLFTTPAIPTWYNTLTKPPIQPPNWLFGPVWTILYILMGVSAFIIWEAKTKKNLKKDALIVFAIQLALNALWSVIFFGQRWILLAFLEIILLWVFILLTIIRFNKISKTAALLQLPYILWVSFASILNGWIWFLNR